MRFSLVNGQRHLPGPGLTGVCPVCGSKTISKCGFVRIHHWAHHSNNHCDHWWEQETEWHRAWKERFPLEWQEYVKVAPSGEKHIADVRTEHDVTIEFQHSHLHPAERSAREKFYGNMVWVVNGRRLVRDLPRFLKGQSNLVKTLIPGAFLCNAPEEIFPANWCECTVPVFFDFGSVESLAESRPYPEGRLWCLLPGRISRLAVVLRVRRNSFVANATARSEPVAVKPVMDGIASMLQALQLEHSLRYPTRVRLVSQDNSHWRRSRRRSYRF